MDQLPTSPEVSIFDLHHETARARIADLQREARRAHAVVQPDPVPGVRQWLGRTLIRLGSALVSEDAIRSARPATHP
jgi:hypothetical protein